MLVYSGTLKTFLQQVDNGEIVEVIYQNILKKMNRNTSKREINSWNNSMMFMNNLLSKEIPLNSGVAIEYNIPLTSKRVDFIITGTNNKGKENAIIIELKQWDEVEVVKGKDAVVKTIINGSKRETTHPSYQALSYANLIKNFSSGVQDCNIQLYPCAYLHNYTLKENDPITAKEYQDYLLQAPIYTKKETKKLRTFIHTTIAKGDNGKILYKIDNGRLRPSKSLQDSVSLMLQGNEEFILIDDQKIVFEEAVALARESFEFNKKNVLIVEGGPGTGKSVVAINLLVSLLNIEYITCYVSKNSSPRNVYASKLKGTKKRREIDSLFKGSGSFTDIEQNYFDAIIVDEAHRLNERSGMFQNIGENQIKEIINSTLFSVFFIDEKQRVHINDIGSTETIISIISIAKDFEAECYTTDLTSQFRCNGSDGYLAWLDNVLQIKETANFDFDFNYECKVIDSPNELRDIIIEKNKVNNKSRLLAGYCWEWKKDSKNNPFSNDIIINDFSISWNLGNTGTWAIDEGSVNQIGCIHTCQGLEFDYVGIIIGEDLRYENGKIVTDLFKRAKNDSSIKGLKRIYKKDQAEALSIADTIIKNTYRTLMSRGMKGCYIYCIDDNLQKYFKKCLGEKNE